MINFKPFREGLVFKIKRSFQCKTSGKLEMRFFRLLMIYMYKEYEGIYRCYKTLITVTFTMLLIHSYLDS